MSVVAVVYPEGQPVAGLNAKIAKSFHPGGKHSVEVQSPRDTWYGQLAQSRGPSGRLVGGTEQLLLVQSPAQLRRVGVAHDGGGDQPVGSGAAVMMAVMRGSVAVGVGDKSCPMVS